MWGYTTVCFAAVERSNNHPLQPSRYSPIDDLYRKVGFTKTNLSFAYTWPTIQADGSVRDEEHPMMFWAKDLRTHRVRRRAEVS